MRWPDSFARDSLDGLRSLLALALPQGRVWCLLSVILNTSCFSSLLVDIIDSDGADMPCAKFRIITNTPLDRGKSEGSKQSANQPMTSCFGIT